LGLSTLTAIYVKLSTLIPLLVLKHRLEHHVFIQNFKALDI